MVVVALQVLQVQIAPQAVDMEGVHKYLMYSGGSPSPRNLLRRQEEEMMVTVIVHGSEKAQEVFGILPRRSKGVDPKDHQEAGVEVGEPGND